MKATIKQNKNVNDLELRDRLSEAVRRAITFRLSPKALLGTDKAAALLTTALTAFDDYNDEIQALDLDPASVFALLDDRKFSDLNKHQQNKFRDMLKAELREQQNITRYTGKILRAHVQTIDRTLEETQERLLNLEEQTYQENPDLLATLAKLPEFNEFKVAADLLAFTERNAGIVEVAEYIKKNIINLGLKLYSERYGN